MEELGGALMAAVARVIPALPVSLLATALLEDGGEAPVSTIDLHARTRALMRRLGAAGAHVYLPREDEAYAIEVGLRMLVQRRLVEERDGGWATRRRARRRCCATTRPPWRRCWPRPPPARRRGVRAEPSGRPGAPGSAKICY